jgi:hypothetical protein
MAVVGVERSVAKRADYYRTDIQVPDLINVILPW